MRFALSAFSTIAAFAVSASAACAEHEIKIHTDDIAEHRQHVIELHANVSQTRANAEEPRRTIFRAMPEYAYGFARNWEVSLSLPLTHRGGETRWSGGRGEVQYVAPSDRAQGFYWGVSAELAYERDISEPRTWVAELTPIFGMRTGKWHFALNPVLKRSFSGPERRAEFEPKGMALFGLNASHEIGIEYYAALGPIEDFDRTSQQKHTVFAVWNYRGAPLDLNFGVGRGLTGGSERWVAKLILELTPK